jgi:hypothetical protein
MVLCSCYPFLLILFIEHGTFATSSNLKFHRFFSQTKSTNVTSSKSNWTPNLVPFLNFFLMQVFEFMLMKLRRKGRNMNKIGYIRIFGVLNFHGPNLWWMNKGGCIKSNARSRWKHIRVFHLQEWNSIFKVHIAMYLEISLKYEYLDSTKINMYFHFQFHVII